MNNESIIYFAKEWNQDRTSCDHVFDQLARHNKVLWVNSIASRAPNLTSAHDWGRIFAKLRKCLGGLKQVGPSAWVYQPVVIPLPYSQWAKRINRHLLRWSLRRIIRRLQMKHPQLWTFLPNSVYMVGELNESLVVYYCPDAVSEFTYLNAKEIAAMERELAGKADLCFATATSLVEHLRHYNPNSHLASHGVDYAHFATALNETTIVPDDLARLSQPVIGFFGIIHNWVDLPLIAAVARKHPEWSVVLIGKTDVDITPLNGLPNVHLLGRRPYASLPAYCKGFQVAVIPFVLNELTRHVNPIKLREYLSAGLPVVSTNLPEVRLYSDYVYLADTPDEFIAKLEQALRDDNPEKRQQRSHAMQQETWDAKVAQVCDQVTATQACKSQMGAPMKIMSVVGARPNFMKIAPFVRAIRHQPREGSSQSVEHILVHTGQHYSPDMSEVFFQELGIPAPDVNLEVGSGSHAYQLGQTMIAFEKPLLELKPDWVIVIGDVNATAACSLTARKHQVAVAHIEAGLRSKDWSMPEEINRVVTDRLSNLLFTPDYLADENLRREGAADTSICRVGNIMIDTLEFERGRAATFDPQRILSENAFTTNATAPHLSANNYAIVTLHRPSNVDTVETLAPLVDVLRQISRSLPVIFSVHPRTRAHLVEFGLWDQLNQPPAIFLVKPLSYHEMLRLNMEARLVLTDSGGLQEECTVLGTHCLTLRTNTERPITGVEHGGTNRLVGNQPERILHAFQSVLPEPRRPFRPEFWDGHTAERILTRLLAG